MATEFSVIYGSFLSKVTDNDLADMTEAAANIVMSDLLQQAIVKFSESCKKNLTDTDSTGFLDDLDIYEVDILSELMVEAWYKPHLNFTELLRNKLSTKDFTTFSPAYTLLSKCFISVVFPAPRNPEIISTFIIFNYLQ